MTAVAAGLGAAQASSASQLAGAGAAGIDIVGNSISNIGSWWHSRQLNKKARSDWRKSLLRGPNYWRRGLVRAGINPLYVFGSGSFPGTALSLQGQAPAARHAGTAAQSARAAALMGQEERLLAAQENRAAAETEALKGRIARSLAEAEYWLSDDGKQTAKEGARREAMGLNSFHGALLSAIFSAVEKEGGGAGAKSAEFESLRKWFFGEGEYSENAPYDIFGPPKGKEKKE